VKLVTVVYAITNECEWRKRNPLKYEHDGLKAVRVGIGDGLDARDALVNLMPYVEEDYIADYATPPYKAAVQHARRAAK
jgi:hypothetical protein